MRLHNRRHLVEQFYLCEGDRKEPVLLDARTGHVVPLPRPHPRKPVAEDAAGWPPPGTTPYERR